MDGEWINNASYGASSWTDVTQSLEWNQLFRRGIHFIVSEHIYSL